MKLNFRSVDLNLLPVFAAVVEEGQLSRAADRLGMSQPAVSAALQRLRLTVGDPLFTRSRSGLNPTPRARELYEQVSNGLGALADALEPGQAFDPSRSGRTFRIVAIDYFESLVLGPVISALREHSAGMGIQILPQLDNWSALLTSAEADLAFDTRRPADERLTAEQVAEESLVVVARRDHPYIRGELTLDDYLSAEHVVLPEREQRTLPLDLILGRPGWQRRIGARVVQYSNPLWVAASSDLIATVPLRLAERLADTLQLQILPFPTETPTVPIFLIWPVALDKDRAHQWFRGFLKDNLPF